MIYQKILIRGSPSAVHIPSSLDTSSLDETMFTLENHLSRVTTNDEDKSDDDDNSDDTSSSVLRCHCDVFE